jgi:hypothetical protein
MKIGNESFIYFVYPFLFDQEHFFELRDKVNNAQWQGRNQKRNIWTTQRFSEDDLLPYVARYLNPSDESQPTAHLWHMDRDALESPLYIGANAKWSLTHPYGEIPFHIESIQLVLFYVGVGFITIKSSPINDDINDWQDFLHYFRFIKGQRGVGIKAQRQVGRGQTEPYFSEPAGGVGKHPDGTGILGDIIDGLLLYMKPDEEENETWWSEVFIPGQMLPFAALFVENIAEIDDSQLLYRVRNFFHSRQVINPSQDDLRSDNPALLPYTGRQWFLFSLDGGAFVGCDVPKTEFFQQTLPDHLSRQYFLLFLITLHQRFALMMLSDIVAKHWLVRPGTTSETEREKTFENILGNLFSFTTRGYFAQVMQQEHHHRCYRKWQETFQLERLYSEVSKEIQEIHNYLLICRTERIQQISEGQQRLERLLSFFAWVLGIPSLIFVYLHAAVEPVGHTLTLLTGAGGVILGYIIFTLLNYLTKRKSSEKTNCSDKKK